MRRFLDVAHATAWRTIHNFITNPAYHFPSIIFPLFFFTAFAGGLSNVGNVPGFDFPSGYTAFQFVFVLLQASAFGRDPEAGEHAAERRRLEQHED